MRLSLKSIANNLAPPYFSLLLHPSTPSHSVRSSSADLLSVPTFRLSTMGARAFLAALHPDPGTHFHYTSISWTPSNPSNRTFSD
ncbi:hypothetical protein LDENG_00228490 [Lucifuga dentata]|nr:hypothetical protein LDENG_00228490 [Lucifuga dentata]